MWRERRVRRTRLLRGEQLPVVTNVLRLQSMGVRLAAVLVVALVGWDRPSALAQQPAADFDALLADAQKAARERRWDAAATTYLSIRDLARERGDELWKARGVARHGVGRLRTSAVHRRPRGTAGGPEDVRRPPGDGAHRPRQRSRSPVSLTHLATMRKAPHARDVRSTRSTRSATVTRIWCAALRLASATEGRDPRRSRPKRRSAPGRSA